MDVSSPKVPVSCSLKENIKSAMKKSIWRIVEHFRKAVLYRPMIQNAKMLKVNVERQLSRPKGWIAECIEFLGDIVLELEDLKTSNSKKLEYFWPTRERGFKIKTTKSIIGGYWVVVGSTRETRGSEWAKANVVLNCDKSVFERNRVDS
ncbi:hypothetical protein H5410_056006, partial [Solanum commersonii]